MSDALRSSWLKLDRAKAHVDDLRAEVMEATEGHPERVGLGRRYDSDHQAVLVYVKSLPEIRNSYGILVGDAIHNFRCALDHLWWALAVRNLGREPTEDEAKDIQFPILSGERGRRAWDSHRFLKHVHSDAAKAAKPMQPFSSDPLPGGTINRLQMLSELSNIDKHRFVHVAVTAPKQITFTPPTIFNDCLPRMVKDASGQDVMLISHHNFPNGPEVVVGDVILRMFVIPDGPNPDVELEADFTCAISLKIISGLIPDMLQALDSLGVRVAQCIREFEPLL